MAYVYRSITLASGESYVLPAGAELVGIDGSITDEAGCANLANVETLTCYIAAIGASDNNNGHSEYGETVGAGSSVLVCKGIFQNGIYTPFINGDQIGYGTTASGSVGCFNGVNIASEVKLLIPGVIDTNASAIPSTEIHDENCLTFILIKTVPSLAESLYLWMAHSVQLDGGNPGATDYVIPFRTFDYWDAIPGLTGKPTCPSSPAP
jgi:hypothetical protein